MSFKIHTGEQTHPAYRAHIEIRDDENNVVAVVNGGHTNAKANGNILVASSDMRESLEKIRGMASAWEGDNPTELIRMIEDEATAALLKAGAAQ